MSTGGFGDESPGFEQDGPTLFPELGTPSKPDDPADSGVWADARDRATWENDAWQRGAAHERERIISLASAMRASIPADHPKGAQASFADYLRVTSADLLGPEDPK